MIIQLKGGYELINNYLQRMFASTENLTNDAYMFVEDTIVILLKNLFAKHTIQFFQGDLIQQEHD